MRYEYRGESLEPGWDDQLTDYLNEYVEEGWDVVSVQWKYREETRYSSNDAYFVLLRRPMHSADA